MYMVKNDMTKPVQDSENPKGLETAVEHKEHKVEKVHKAEKEIKKEVPKIDVIKKIMELHNEGVPTSKIGLILRDEFKVHNVKKYSGKTINQILVENKLESEIPEDLSDLLKRAVKLLKHMKINKRDQSSKLGYQRTVSKIRRLAKYYKRVNKLPKGWTYSEEQAAILVK